MLDREQTAVQTDFVKAEFERQAREVETAFTDKARVVAEHFGKKVDEVFAEESGSLTKALVRHFGEESNEAVQHRVRALVDQTMREAQQNMLKQFSSSDGSQPAGRLQAGRRAAAARGRPTRRSATYACSTSRWASSRPSC